MSSVPPNAYRHRAALFLVHSASALPACSLVGRLSKSLWLRTVNRRHAEKTDVLKVAREQDCHRVIVALAGADEHEPGSGVRPYTRWIAV
jgi:hypothetical protein